ncbi:glycosyltransferase [Sporosarcina globispora]|uniref:glycosyltransferase n=1 Tax=Sporosarcina globispora TaxID=1459 RepID=UPI0006A97E37|nr:glycosyltransferase [Sporosarcina globispora]
MQKKKIDFIENRISQLNNIKLDLTADLCDRSFYNRMYQKIDNLSVSNGTKFFTKLDMTVAFVGDDYSFQLLKDVARVIKLKSHNLMETFKTNEIDFIMYVPPTSHSIPRSSGNYYEMFLDSSLEELFQIAGEKGIKTVLYDMEASIQALEYTSIIKNSDFIFTVQREKIEKIKGICNHQNVFEIGLGFNPLINNPIGRKMNDDSCDLLHIGSFDNYSEEVRENFNDITRGLFDETVKPQIIDLHFKIGKNISSFPIDYISHTSSNEFNTLQLAKVYKEYDWALAINELKYSETGFSPVIYELLASGCNVLSNYNVYLNNKFPNVFIISNEGEAESTIHSFKGIRKVHQQNAGIRMTFKDSTIFHQFPKIVEKLGLKGSIKDKKVLVLADRIDENLLEMFNKQTYEHKDLLTINEVTEESCNHYDMIAFFSADKNYGEFYLEDMINAFKYTNCDYITRNCYYENSDLIDGIVNDYTDRMLDKFATVFWRESFGLKELCRLNGKVMLKNGYSLNNTEFNNSKNLEDYATKSSGYKLSVIVPIYNNGKYLLYKCFNSLQRSSMFKEMEILLVDDGSNDGYTPKIVNRLSNQYDNVKSYFFNDGGSGSASRPRNKGNVLASAEYITYLDPDNEAVNDGYKKLYEQIVDTDYDFVIGNMKTLSNSNELMAIYGENKENLDPTSLLIKYNFKPQSIQALVIKKDFVLKNELEMVIGSAGQDTLFFQELMINAKNVKVTDILVHLYYSAVENSTVNSINKKYFHKVYLREVETNKRLSKYGLIDEYKKRRFQRFFKLWYLKKLAKVKVSDIEESVKILYDIYSIHKEGLELTDKRVARFVMLYEKERFETLYNDFIYKLR